MDEVMSSLVFLLAKLRTVCDGNMTNNTIINILYILVINLKKNIRNNITCAINLYRTL